SAGAATGPTIGALPIDWASWRALFWLNVPIGLFAITMAMLRVPETHVDEGGGRRLDPLGVPMATTGVALIMLAIVQYEEWGLSDVRSITLILVGLALLPLAIHRSRSHPRPAIDLSLFRVRTFGPAVIVVSFYGCGFLAGFLSTTLYLQELWEYGVLTTGLALSPGPILA
ncbi:MAG: MFS transporter, partial [Actinomycetia bacterium]|nr:MFS transporter [Actinomycetes bacterium]